MPTDCHQDFRQAVDRPEDKIELGRAALAIAVSEYPQLDFAHYLSRIDHLAVTAAERLSGHPTGYRAIAALNSQAGNLFAIGGAITSGGTANQALFVGSGDTSPRRLVLTATAVPEPTALALLGLGASVVVFSLLSRNPKKQTSRVKSHR